MRAVVRGSQDGKPGWFLVRAGSSVAENAQTDLLAPAQTEEGLPAESPVADIDPAGRRVAVAWISGGRLFWSLSTDGGSRLSRPAAALDRSETRDIRSPALAWGRSGRFLLAWAEGDSIEWQIRKENGAVVESGRDPSLGKRDRFALGSTRDGSFILVY